MIPILYSKTETSFDGNGLGWLTECESATVTSGRNDSRYEATITYPCTGALYSSIGFDSIIKLRANERDDDQLFRVYAISKPMDGMVTYSLEHVSYQLSKIYASKAGGEKMTAAEILNSAITSAKSNYGLTTFPFTADVDYDTANSTKLYYSKTDVSIREVIFDIIDLFGGEVAFDNYRITIRPSVGVDRNALIQYGMNMIDVTSDGDISDIYTSCRAHWSTTKGGIVDSTTYSSYAYRRIYELDCSDDFSSKPTTAQLNAKATAWLTENADMIPNISVEYAPRW